MSNLNNGGLTRVLNYIKTWVNGLLSGKANSSHTHTKSQITDFPSIPSKTSQLTNDSGYLTSHQSLSNYVTLNSAQTISSNKTFSGLTKTSGKVGYDTSGNDVNNAIYNMETTTWGPDTANKPSSNYGTLLSLNREVNVHTSAGIGWIAQFGIGTDTRLYLRTKTNIGGAWSGWREFSDIGHTHTKSQITDFPTIPTNTSQLSNDSGYITADGAAYPRRVGGVTMNFNWYGQGGQPTWLWGGEDGTNMYVYNPANFSVNYANSAGSSSIATRDSGGLWISGRDNAVVKQTRHSTSDGNSWNPAVSVKTKSGNWTIGTVGYDKLQFSYDTDADYNAGSNRSIVVELNPESGRIITSGNTGNISISGYQVYVG